MGMLIEFPSEAAARRPALDAARSGTIGTVLILPVVRIERESDETSGDRDPETGATPGRRRRRRARS